MAFALVMARWYVMLKSLFLVGLLLSVGFLSACGGGEGLVPTIPAPIVPTSPANNGADSTTIHETITTPLLVGKKARSCLLSFQEGIRVLMGLLPSNGH